jgi:hypothetical protein
LPTQVADLHLSASRLTEHADSIRASVCEHTFVIYRYTVTEHEQNRPWIVVDQQRHSIDLEDAELFFDWAAENWPADRFTVVLDPCSLSDREGSAGPD